MIVAKFRVFSLYFSNCILSHSLVVCLSTRNSFLCLQNIFLTIEHGFMVLDGNLEGCSPVFLRKFHADCHEILRATSA